MTVSMTSSDLKGLDSRGPIFIRRMSIPYVCSYRLTNSDQILHGNARRGGGEETCLWGLWHAPSQWRLDYKCQNMMDRTDVADRTLYTFIFCPKIFARTWTVCGNWISAELLNAPDVLIQRQIAVEIAAPSLYSTSLDCGGQRFSHCAEAGNALVRCN